MVAEILANPNVSWTIIFNYGVLGLWTFFLLQEKKDMRNEFKDLLKETSRVIENNTVALVSFNQKQKK